MLMLLPLLAVPACYSVTYSSTIFPFHSVTYRTLMTRYDSRRYIASSPAQECFLLYFPRRCVGFFLVFSERGRSFSLSPNLLSFSRNLVPANTAPPSKVPRKGSWGWGWGWGSGCTDYVSLTPPPTHTLWLLSMIRAAILSLKATAAW